MLVKLLYNQAEKCAIDVSEHNNDILRNVIWLGFVFASVACFAA